eukprot:COSAG02_NODE_26044_length_642_cov_1.213628_1_plen_57_part_01
MEQVRVVGWAALHAAGFAALRAMMMPAVLTRPTDRTYLLQRMLLSCASELLGPECSC